MNRLNAALVVAGLCALAAATPARAQGLGQMMQSNADFDRQQANMLNGLIQQNQQRMQSMRQNFVQQNYQQLSQNYVRSGANRTATFDQYVDWVIATADGTNIQGAIDAQNDRFRVQQEIHRGQVQSGERQIAGMRRNSDAAIGAVDQWDNTAIRGNSPHVNPVTGQTIQLPNAVQPGQIVNWGGYTYRMGRDNEWQVRNGNQWVGMDDDE